MISSPENVLIPPTTRQLKKHRKNRQYVNKSVNASRACPEFQCFCLRPWLLERTRSTRSFFSCSEAQRALVGESGRKI